MATIFRPMQRVATTAVRGVRQLHLSKPCNDTFTTTDAVMPKPYTTKFTGYMGVTVATSLGVFAGAEMSKNIASFLEENELFVPSDDDDDD
ncbi:Essential MCU regulator-like [Homarus americanus]|uniref:Essential MCU regulator, mitochondrial n=1 Tax=Homarus americanus TaxID=6706 RepID=A0A8J5JLK8_HOMAM|nr:Essential MCU regulator-like [Homarus americanus]